jgi:branched-chain amino acid transport system permease protein
MGQVLISGLVNGGIYGILALGIVIVYRGSRVLNFAQAEMGTFGLYIAYSLIVDRDMPWIVGAFAALVVVAAMSWMFERFVIRQLVDSPRVTVAVATIGLLLLLLALEVKIWGSGPKFLAGPVAGSPFGSPVLGYVVSWTQLLALVVAAAVGFGLNAFLRRTDFGLGVLAAAQDSVAVRMMGVSFARVSAFTWVTAGVLGALAVLLVEPSIGSFFPGHFSVGANALFIPALAAALIGRLDNLTHAFLGGLGVGIAQQAIQRQFVDSTIPGVSTVAVFAIIIGALLLRSPVRQVAGEAA